MINFLTDPIPHEDARRRIADKPAVARDIFDQLPDEMKSRAFTITGIEDTDVVQAVRDEIASLPAGADWNKVKKEIMAKVSPWFTPEQAASRAQLLMSHHAFAAYSSTQARIMDSMIDVFPYRQYLSTKDGKVRASHAALHEIILPSTHQFWQYHTPPWEWNCRCQVVELTAEDKDEEYRRDQQRAPENRRVLEGPHLAQLDTGSLNRGLSTQVDIRTPKERGGTYQWSARETNMPYDQIRTRWTPDVAQGFETWAKSVPMESGITLLDTLTGKPITPAPRTPSLPRPASFADALARLGLDTKNTWTRKDIADLKASLRVANPAKESDHVETIIGARQTGALTEAEIRRGVQDLLSIIPRSMADTLPKVTIKLVDTHLDGANGDFVQSTNTIRVTTHNLAGKKGEARRRELHRILSHELMHWAHLSSTGPAADAYRNTIRDHYRARTKGEKAINGYRRDKWWDIYAGKEYKFEKGKPRGVEVPTRYYELWETPDILAEIMDPAKHPNSKEHRETFALVHTFFDTNP